MLIISVLSINIFLQLLPLTNVIGYEFSAVNGILLFVLAGISVIHYGREKEEFHPFKIFAANYKLFLSLTFSPLIISVVNTAFFSICPFNGGIEFYLIDTIPAAFIGLILGAISLRLSFRYSYIFFLIIFLIFVFTPIFELYFFHQMYFYSPLIGFFPGTIYDENITMNSKHFLYQLFSVKIVFLAYVLLIKKEKRFKIYLPFFVVYFLFISLIKPFLGFATNINTIEKTLPNKFSTEHFELIYPGGISEVRIKTIAAEHEFYYQKIKSQLGYEPEGKIRSILFENRKQKGKIFGAENADVAKLWMNTMYLQVNDYESTLEHEMAHVFSKDIGTTPFKVAYGFNFSLIEGYAMAVENEYGGKEVHHFAALAYKNNFKVLPKHLFSGLNFFSNVSGLSYVISGSFIKFLIENYSSEAVNKVYADGDFEKNFNKSIEELSDEYEKFISSYPIDSNPHTSALYFGRKPLVKRFCPRYIARKRASAEEFVNKKDYNRAQEIYEEIFSLTNQYFALTGLIECYRNKELHSEALKLTERFSEEYVGTSYKYGYNINLADLYLLNGFNHKADSLYSELIYENPNISFSNYAKTRKLVLTLPDSVSDKFIMGSGYDKYIILKNLNDNNPKDYLVTALLNLSRNLNEDYDNFIVSIKDNLKIVSEETSFAAYLLSEYAKINSRFDDAIKYAKLALDCSNDKSRIPILKENLEKLDWMKLYCD